MPPNINEDQSLNSPNPRDRNAPDDYIPIQDVETINQNQATKNMEVHHHPEVEKKSFKEYLLEGLMIFIAVSMGFIAENIRENLVNKEKEKKYMESMLADLKKDTAEVRQVIYLQSILIKKMDSALSFPVEKLRNIDVQDSFYHHFIYFYGWEWTFTRYDNTISQLKNAGGFSILKNRKVVDSMDSAFGVIFSYGFAWEAALRNFRGSKKLVPSTSEAMFLVCPDNNDVGVYFFSNSKSGGDTTDTVS